MQVCQFIYEPEKGWSQSYGETICPDLLLAFGSGKECDGSILVSWRNKYYPSALLLGCSTSGEISGTTVLNNTIIVTAIKFSRTSIELRSINFSSSDDSQEVGKKLAQSLPKQHQQQNLKYCFVLSDGLNINGTQFVSGLTKSLPEDVTITGGLAGDGKRFQETQICVNENYGPNKVAALGFYGEALDVQYGSLGGWDAFGPSRAVTRSDSNILYELDGHSALDLYKKYLGEYAEELPSSGLHFPLKITTQDNKEFVRAVLGINEEQGSLIFGGDIPEGSYAKLMRANFDRLIDGAADAAQNTLQRCQEAPDLAILISCVGRRLVLNQRVEEEVEAVRDILGEQTVLAGFYSYGEICPLFDEVGCTLHNQTMTITTFNERVL